jgi:hypothetical protein
MMSGWQSKKRMNNKFENSILNYSISWTQKYPNSWAGIRNVTEDELRLEIVDNIVGHMKAYPDVESLLKRIFLSNG